ncbi:MAG: bifunctional diaminohydroxyphosphoribosylaminopyrimidine deaminase/5-amino-6-(5-phosphoribosylamino)uracil reductase RibD [Burkholderiaceae bacterium]|jgi:diaminohydroxyphosphoribosylaminopyrimidine deaminase/5-amino-6-(5-phosphoribosylamino)uracil reductase|nr:bifunctional diaminohydroxyphosphoribosylaminopyrimidine deaminase/5-amino-6-(5-phosphoribosylamino)uracil reductase RibD [Burkholderiaceae bacterium]
MQQQQRRLDQDYMRLALEQASQAVALSPPNPAVGCVLVAADGAVIGAGHTQAVGGAHAEIMALRDASARGLPVRGATAYVTLEPCAHHGRTPPCCEALANAGIARVVASLQDPNPQVAGRGLAHLRAAGVAVDVGLCADQARELNLGFLSRMRRGRPWVRLKVACSLDGRTALPNGASQWITGEAARADGHLWRARAGAVLTGIGTVLRDNPRLNVRLRQQAARRQPPLVVADSRLQLPQQAALWSVPERPVWVYTTSTDARAIQRLVDRGARVAALPNANGQVDLPALLRDLAGREVNELHVEAGARLNGALLRAGLVDELLVYQAPLLMGEGAAMAALGPWNAMAQTLRFAWHSMERLGQDVRLLARLTPADSL